MADNSSDLLRAQILDMAEILRAHGQAKYDGKDILLFLQCQCGIASYHSLVCSRDLFPNYKFGFRVKVSLEMGKRTVK